MITVSIVERDRVIRQVIAGAAATERDFELIGAVNIVNGRTAAVIPPALATDTVPVRLGSGSS